MIDMSESSLKEKMKEAIIEWDEDGLREMCKSAIESKEASAAVLLKIIGDVMGFIGKQFENEEIFLPDLIGSADTVKTIIDEILDPAIRASGEEKKTKGKVVLGTVESDVHSIGKDLVGSFLFSNGFEVYNLGVDVPAQKFIEKAEEVGAQIIAMSSLLTMSMDFQRQLIKELESRGIREKYKIIVGGSPTSDEWAGEIGADGWADDAIEAVTLVNKILNIQ
ncbi:MAG: dimethylamine corrinoid protein 3 [Promethearchaeota archaeon]|nr:MAG: dimethylamine corrinoid protein 3 [Candidatus Lokiarchaeota archaeon]